MLLAQAATAPATQPAAVDKPWYVSAFENPILLFGAVMIFMLFFMGKGKRTDEKARQEQLKQLKRGDRIQTIGGVQGTVVRTEEARIEVKVDESSNTKIWFVRNAIAKVVEAGKEEK
jgi:preprotein translocase subunit YajC